MAMRFALLYQPADNVKITPSIAFQDKQQHDDSTYWLAYSNPSRGQFNDATPELIPQPDKYYLAAREDPDRLRAHDADIEQFVYHRDQQDLLPGHRVRLAFYPGYRLAKCAVPGGPPLGCGSHRPRRRSPAPGIRCLTQRESICRRFTDYSTPNTINNQTAIMDAGIPSAIERRGTPEVDHRPVPVNGGGLSIEQLNDPNINQFLSAPLRRTDLRWHLRHWHQ